jgi:hypothetical protein
MRYFITFYTFPSNGQTATGVLLTTNSKGNRTTRDYLIAYLSKAYAVRESLINIKETAEISRQEFDRINNV